MKKYFKILGAVFGIVPITIAVIIGGWSVLQRSGDPIQQLTRDYSMVRSEIDSSYTVTKSDGRRNYQDITLYSQKSDSIQITLSLPNDKTAEQLPVLLILGGLEIGRESLTYIDEPGQNALIGYNYPYSPDYWYKNTGPGEIPAIRNAVLEVPAQISAILQWCERQTWADTTRINLLGYSFGAIFLPSVFHYAQTNKLSVNTGIMAYGGADLYQLLYSNLTGVLPFVRAGIAWVASSAIYPVEPLEHLPSLEGTFLLINGKRDKKIPHMSWRTLQTTTPEPKTVMNLDASHMHPDNVALTEKIVDLSRHWLKERKAVNP